MIPYLRAIAVFVALVGFVCFGIPLRCALRGLGRSEDALSATLFCRSLCRALGVRVSQRGSLAAGPAIVVANHVSWLDVIVLGRSQSLCFLAKREVASWPAFGALARAQDCVFVDRRRRMQVPDVNRQIADRLLANKPMVLFAEATTSDGTRVRTFHSSHFAAARDALARDPTLSKIVIQPVSIAYRNRRGLPLGRAGRAGAAWYGDMEFLPSIWRLLIGGRLDCEVTYGKPIDFLRADDRKAATRQAERAVRRLVGSSLTGRAPPGSIAALGPVLIGSESA